MVVVLIINYNKHSERSDIPVDLDRLQGSTGRRNAPINEEQ